jgi:hypothetical protein
MGYQVAYHRLLLIFEYFARRVTSMKRIALLTVFLASLAAGEPALAACYADYKAKQDNPLRLHYGVMRIDTNPCAMSEGVKATVASRLASAGWQLLQVQSVFDDSGLEKRKSDAGQYFLRF